MSRMEDKQTAPKVTMFGPGGGADTKTAAGNATNRAPVEVPERRAQYYAG